MQVLEFLTAPLMSEIAGGEQQTRPPATHIFYILFVTDIPFSFAMLILTATKMNRGLKAPRLVVGDGRLRRTAWGPMVGRNSTLLTNLIAVPMLYGT